MSDFYREKIMDHYRNPRNQKPISNPNYQIEVDNVSCGDKLSLDLQVKNDIIEEVHYQAIGCVVSTAAASIFSEYLKGKKLSEVKSLNEKEIFEKIGIETSPARVKCVLLPFEAIKEIKI